MRKFVINVNGKSYEVDVEEVKDGSIPVAAPPVSTPKAAPAAQSAPVIAPKEAPAAKPATNSNNGSIIIKSPMPGNIWDIKVNVGDTISKGQVLLILEAMKMENEIMAPQDAKVVSIPVTKGTTVNSGDILITME